jgi:hypothetical protein
MRQSQHRRVSGMRISVCGGLALTSSGMSISVCGRATLVAMASRARMLACEYACDGVRTHAARWLPWIMRGINTSEEEMEQDSQEIVKLAMVVVGGLTALCLCEWRRLRSVCQTYSDIDGVDRGNATRLPGAHEARGGCYRRAHGTMLVCVTKVKRCLSNLPRHRRRQNPSTGEATRVVASHEACGVRCGCLMGLCWCE